jgi:hypothetical protein
MTMKDWRQIESPSERHQRIERESIAAFEKLLFEKFPHLKEAENDEG